MPEPRTDSLADLQFRPRAMPAAPRPGGPDHFWAGVAIFLLVAMVYPFYSYAVHSYLLGRELDAAAAMMSDELDRLGAEARREADETRRAAAAESMRQRQRGVTVVGTTTIRGKRVVVVNLGQASLAEAKARICAQAERNFREPLAGEELRIQRHRGNQPAMDAGTIICD